MKSASRCSLFARAYARPRLPVARSLGWRGSVPSSAPAQWLVRPPLMLGALLLLLLLIDQSKAAFPQKPIKIIVYTDPGGLIDVTARRFADVASRYTNATFVVMNKKGAGGLVAMKSVLQRPADGYTLFACTKSNIAKVVSSGDDSYLSSFAWIALLMADPECVITRSDSPLNSWTALIDDARKQDGHQNWVGPAVGGLDHVMAIKTWDKVGISANWIPHASGGKAKLALLSRRGDAYVGNPGEALENPDLAVVAVSSTRRLAQLPRVPTFGQLNLDGLDEEYMWRGFAVKKGCPPEALAWYDRLFAQVTGDAAWRTYWEKNGIDVKYVRTREFTSIVARDKDEFARYLHRLGVLQSSDEGVIATLFAGPGLLGTTLTLVLLNLLVGTAALIFGKRAGELLIPFALVCFCVLLLGMSFLFPSSGKVGAAFVPRLWIAVLLPICGLLMSEPWRRGLANLDYSGSSRRVWTSVTLMGVYLVSIYFIGYYASTLVFLVLGMFLLGVRRVTLLVAVPVGWLLLSYYVFAGLLLVPFPQGILLEPWFR